MVSAVQYIINCMFYSLMYFIFLNARVEPLYLVRNNGACGIKTLVTITSYMYEFCEEL